MHYKWSQIALKLNQIVDLKNGAVACITDSWVTGRRFGPSTFVVAGELAPAAVLIRTGDTIVAFTLGKPSATKLIGLHQYVTEFAEQPKA